MQIFLGSVILTKFLRRLLLTEVRLSELGIFSLLRFYLTLYNSLVQPHFDYCNVVWGNCSKSLSSKLQTKGDTVNTGDTRDTGDNGHSRHKWAQGDTVDARGHKSYKGHMGHRGHKGYRGKQGTQGIHGTQGTQNRIRIWLAANKLTLNMTKTEFLLIGSRQRLSTLQRNPIIEINKFQIKQVSTSKSIGVHIDGNLSWECHINEISKKIASDRSAIKRIRYFLPFEILLNIIQFTGTATL